MEEEKPPVNQQRRNLLVGAASTVVAGTFSASAKAQNNSYRPLPAGKIAARGYAAYSTKSALRPLAFERRSIGPNDVVIDIQFCGVCHSDIHTGRGDWGEQRFPLVTGHEIAGVITAVGSAVSRFRVGDRVGVGCMVDSCGTCPECVGGSEQYCETQAVFTYGSPSSDPGGYTQGGYSNVIVVRDKFVIRIPDSIELSHAGPIMCAAVTVYSPLRHWQVRAGGKVGVVGMGGLGHIAVQLARAMGAEVVVFTTSADKVSDARRFGASHVVLNYGADEIAKHRRSFDFILDTVPYQHEMNPLFPLLKRDATVCLVGIGRGNEANQLLPFITVPGRNSFAGSLIGSIRETQEVIDFCAEKGIKPSVTVIPIQSINSAWDDVVAKKARYRYVIDMKTLGS